MRKAPPERRPFRFRGLPPRAPCVADPLQKIAEPHEPEGKGRDKPRIRRKGRSRAEQRRMAHAPRAQPQQAKVQHEQHERDIEAFENYIREGVSEEELKTFFEVLEKISNNVSAAETEFAVRDEREGNNA